MEQLNYYNQICEDIDLLIENKYVFNKAEKLIKTNVELLSLNNSKRSNIDPEHLSLSMYLLN